MTDAPRTIWAVPPITGTFSDGIFMASAENVSPHRYHHDDVVQELRRAGAAIVEHDLFCDREYLSADLNAKIDALRSALAKLDATPADPENTPPDPSRVP